jgi:site-specific DNA recombinase
VATDIHIGLRGMFGAMFLKDLAAKVRRGHFGRVREGLVPGIVAYGYERVLGKPGERVVNQEEAAVVRRIFTEYANGTSPRAIALGLTRDKIPSPSGDKGWSHQSFTSGGGKSGILGNRLYIGELVWNRHHNVQDPETGIISVRANPDSEHTTVNVPHLHILDQALWDAAQAVRQRRTVLNEVRAVIQRSEHLLSGLLRCGHCNGHMILTYTSRGKQYVTCSAAHVKSACSHRKPYNVDKLKSLVIDSMCEHLTDPGFIKEKAKAKALEFAKVQKENSSARLAAEKQRIGSWSKLTG